jgi:hypothetical protein
VESAFQVNSIAPEIIPVSGVGNEPFGERKMIGEKLAPDDPTGTATAL